MICIFEFFFVKEIPLSRRGGLIFLCKIVGGINLLAFFDPSRIDIEVFLFLVTNEHSCFSRASSFSLSVSLPAF